MARVLVLREAEDAARTADVLRAHGHEPLLLPLQEVRPLDPPLEGGPFGGFLATSAHAAPWLARHAAGTALPVLAVGERTAEALRAAGLPEVVAGPGRARDLPALAARLPSGDAPLVYAAGRTRLPDLEAGLLAADVRFRTLEVYDMVERRPGEDELDRLTESGPPDAVLLLSRGQAALFEALAARRPGLRPAALRHLCLSSAVADGLSPGRVAEWPAEPSLDALLARLG
ncbi:uroporphyrinogen-III synthase [Aureimonas sp. SK2]|uniref:uroporphyrinogen-III synthase n=1 Tax=Aureimonas sp. SK2 TaxID=3015992 RepID=UPI0024451567|nr:uroporphyrinogen-III synthase [Aureimonas sp. SK2]